MPAQTGQKVFGAGRLYGVPTTTPATPSPFGVLQEMSLDMKRDIKRLHGLNQLPVDVAAGMLTVTGKGTMGQVGGRLLNDLFIGGSLSTGQVPWVANETLTVTTGSTAATVANGAGFQIDLGIYATTLGVALAKVSTAATLSTGQYYNSTAGVYSFSSLEALTSFKASYLYSTTGGQTVTMTNQAMGKTGNFQAVMDLLWGTEKGSIWLYNCMASDLSYATKLDDYMKPAFGFDAATDSTDTLGLFSFAEIT